MPIDSTLRGLMLRIDEKDDPGTQPELSYNFANSAKSTSWTLARIKAYPQFKDFGGELAFETSADNGMPSDTTIERMRIDKNGNVGIGTAEPKAPLHVANYMVVGPFSATTGAGGIDVTGPVAELGFVKRSLTAWPATPAAGNRFVWYNPDGTARLRTEQQGDLLTVTSTGNVGIGTTTPDANFKLDVNGGLIKAGGLSVTGDASVKTLKVTNQGNDAVLLDLNSDRHWQLKQVGTKEKNNVALALVDVSEPGGGNFVINAGNVSILKDLRICGNLGVGGPSQQLQGRLDIAGIVRFGLDEEGSGTKVISFARDTDDDKNAGKIAYKPGWYNNYDNNALAIIGAGKSGQRQINMWDEVKIIRNLVVGPFYEPPTPSGTWKQGIDCSVKGAGHKQAGRFEASSAQDSLNDLTTGLSAFASSQGNGTVKGLEVSATGDGTGTKQGIYCSVSGVGTKWAGTFEASSEAGSSDTTIALIANANNEGTNDACGLAVHSYGSGKGFKCGIDCSVKGAGYKKAGIFDASSEAGSSEDTEALSASASSEGAGKVKGLKVSATGDGTGDKYGIECRITGDGTGDKYGIYSQVDGGGRKYAGYFVGNVLVRGTLSSSIASFEQLTLVQGVAVDQFLGRANSPQWGDKASDDALPTQLAVQDYVNAKFDTTSGHNHDGTNSKKITAADKVRCLVEVWSKPLETTLEGTWEDMLDMKRSFPVASDDTWFHILVLVNGVGVKGDAPPIAAAFKLIVEGMEEDWCTRHDFLNNNAVCNITLSRLVKLAAGDHTISVQWIVDKGTLYCCEYNDCRQLQIIEL